MVVALSSLLIPRLALADEKTACIAAADAGQAHRDAKRLWEARASFLTCAGEACPKIVRASCESWLGEVNALQPTVVFRAVDGDGKDLVDVQVLVDGKEVQSTMTGNAVPLDPGPHKVAFVHRQYGTIEQAVVVAESEKGRRISGQFAKARPAAPVAAAPSRTPPAEAPTQARGIPVVPVAIGGAGVVALIVSGVFFASYSTGKGDLADRCTSDGKCPPSEQSTIDSANRAGTISLVAGVAGLAGVGVGTYLLVAGPGTTSASVGMAPGGGAVGQLGGRF